MLFADHVEHRVTRRGLLARAAMLAALPLLARCGSRSEAPRDAPPDPRPGIPGREPQMRVRVVRARGDDARASVGGERQWVRVGPDAEGAEQVVMRGPLTVRVAEARWSVIDANGARAPASGLEALRLAAMGDGEPALAIGDRAYPGSARLVARPDLGERAFDVVNLVPMEQYLPGVVKAELFDHWDIRTRSAQAVAARSFAASEHAYFKGRRAYDVSNTAHSQAYGGAVGHDASHEAVEATRGLVLGFEGRLVSGYYSSCCGGTAACAVDAIGANPINDIAPLRGHRGEDACTGAVLARWTITRPVAELTRRLAEWGKHNGVEDLGGLDEVTAIKVVARNTHGRPTRYAVKGRGAAVELAAERLRAAANHRTEGLEAPKPLWSSFLHVSVDGTSADFRGRGHGHGVGMCQYGAEAMARDGAAYERMLSWYYPGAELVKGY